MTSHRCEKMAVDLVSALSPFQSKWRVGQVFPLLFVRLPWVPRSVHFLFKIPSWKAACLWQPQCPLRDQANKTNWAWGGCPLSCLTPCFLAHQHCWEHHTDPQEPSPVLQDSKLQPQESNHYGRMHGWGWINHCAGCLILGWLPFWSVGMDRDAVKNIPRCLIPYFVFL